MQFCQKVETFRFHWQTSTLGKHSTDLPACSTKTMFFSPADRWTSLLVAGELRAASWNTSKAYVKDVVLVTGEIFAGFVVRLALAPSLKNYVTWIIFRFRYFQIKMETRNSYVVVFTSLILLFFSQLEQFSFLFIPFPLPHPRWNSNFFSCSLLFFVISTIRWNFRIVLTL